MRGKVPAMMFQPTRRSDTFPVAQFIDALILFPPTRFALMGFWWRRQGHRRGQQRIDDVVASAVLTDNPVAPGFDAATAVAMAPYPVSPQPRIGAFVRDTPRPHPNPLPSCTGRSPR